jgi:hypothetical protein
MKFSFKLAAADCAVALALLAGSGAHAQDVPATSAAAASASLNLADLDGSWRTVFTCGGGLPGLSLPLPNGFTTRVRVQVAAGVINGVRHGTNERGIKIERTLKGQIEPSGKVSLLIEGDGNVITVDGTATKDRMELSGFMTGGDISRNAQRNLKMRECKATLDNRRAPQSGSAPEENQ